MASRLHSRWLLARGREADGDDAIERLLGCDASDERFVQVKENIVTSVKLEREQKKTLTLKTLFTGDGSPTGNVRRIWLAPLLPYLHSSIY